MNYNPCNDWEFYAENTKMKNSLHHHMRIDKVPDSRLGSWMCRDMLQMDNLTVQLQVSSCFWSHQNQYPSISFISWIPNIIPQFPFINVFSYMFDMSDIC